jgi:hypothetical protein
MTARLLCFMGWHRWWYKFPDEPGWAPRRTFDYGYELRHYRITAQMCSRCGRRVEFEP